MEIRGRTILLWVTIMVLCVISIPIHFRGPTDQSQLEQQFTNYTQQYGKAYETEIERERRFAAFQESLLTIHRLNGGDRINLAGSEGVSPTGTRWTAGDPKNVGSATWGLTPFADLSPEEFQNQFLSPNFLHHIHLHRKSHPFQFHHHNHLHHPIDGVAFENNEISRKKRAVRKLVVDWRKKGVVTPVKQQSSCGACWAFSTVETVESMNALATGELEVLSVQQVIDCSKNGNLGCNGGDTCTAIEWMAGKELTTEADYPTTLKTQTCKLMSPSDGGVRVRSNYSCRTFAGKEDEILQILQTHGPVTVAVEATNWQYYVGGIIQWNCATNLNHAVQIVGYNQTGEVPYYIVRNSWGPGFGDKGYLYIAVGSNLCGVASHVAWLSVS